MPSATNDLPSPVNHVFVDFENVHEINLAVIGSKAVSFTLLVGPKQTKLDVSLVERLFEHAASVQLVRLKSAGKNALDFILTYYVGRAVAADPTGYFHIVSKDTGYDPLIEHLNGKHIRVRRHNDFTSLTFLAAKLPAVISPASAPASKPLVKLKTLPAPSETLEARVLRYLRKPTTNRPRTKKKLVSDLITHLGKKVPELEVLELIKMLSQAGQLVIDDKDKVAYHLEIK